MTIAADVADLAAMRAALTEVRERFGAIHGVFHAAGMLKDEIIALARPVVASPVLDSKMKGAWCWTPLLADEPLDFFVLFSSVSSILGLPGQADYTAANAFLDALAQARGDRGRGAASPSTGMPGRTSACWRRRSGTRPDLRTRQRPVRPGMRRDTRGLAGVPLRPRPDRSSATHCRGATGSSANTSCATATR